jgi:hypothetical protein
MELSQIPQAWAERGFSCTVWTDPPGQVWANFVHEVEDTTWRVMVYEEERGIKDKKLAYAESRSFRPLQRSLAFASCAGLQKQL